MRQRMLSAVRFIVVLCIGSSAALAATVAPTGHAVPGEVLVRMAAGASAQDVAGVERAGGIEQSDRVAALRSGTLWRMRARGKSAEALVEALQRNPNVEYAEPNYIVRLTGTPNDASYAQLWGLKNSGQNIFGFPGTAGSDISAEQAWDITTGSSAIVIGVVDTGINYNHPDLAANVWNNPGGKGNVACAAGTHGFNAITRTCDPADNNYHGSHVAGTIGAVGNNGVGVAGVNWTTSIMGLKFLGSNGHGTVADAIAAIDFAIQAKIDGVNVRVLSNSWGGGGFSKALLDIINKANEHDILFVAAAGNDASNTDVYAHYPSSYTTPNMISVAATDNRDRLANFSNYGPTTVHIGAPGVDVLSTSLGSSYQYASGTSMATPHVSGVAALLLAKTPSLTTAQVKSAILQNADLIPSLNGLTTTGGRLNAARVLGAPPIPSFTIAALPSSRTVARNSSTSYVVNITPLNGFAGSVDLSVTGLPSGATASFSPASTTSTSTLTVTTTNSTSLSTYTLTITGVSGSITRATAATLVVATVVPSSPCSSFASTRLTYIVGSSVAVARGDFNRDGRADLASAVVNTNRIAVLLGSTNGGFAPGETYNTGIAPVFVAVDDFNRDGKPDLVSANSGMNNVSVLLGNGDGSFQTAVHHGAGMSPFAVATGDFDADGNPDLAVANNGGGDVSILLGAGDGTFAAAVPYSVGAGPFWIAVADFDSDGRSDLAVAAFNANKVSILIGNGDGTFAAPAHYNTATNPSAVAVADFNRDGAMDLAVSNYVSNSISILAGNGDGTFQAAVHQPTVGVGPYSVVTLDLNEDGRTDLATANSESGTISTFLGNGNGTFQSATQLLQVTLRPNHLIAADLNGDGRDDLAFTDSNDYYVSVLLNIGVCAMNCGAFTATAVAAGTNPDSVAAGDLNGDGRADLAVVNIGSDDIAIRLGNGDGTFIAGVTAGAGTDPDAVTAADLDRDGDLDLAVANSGSHDVSVLLGNGDGTFQTAVLYAAGTNPRSVVSGDFNRDGRLDLAVANGGSANVSLLLGNGNGTFQSATQFNAGTSPSALTTGDLNRDGRLDLAVANSGSNNVSLLLGNGNGTFAAAVNFAAGTSPSAIVAADVNRDGKPDLAVANSGSGNVSVLIGDGSGGFQAVVNTAAGTAPSGIAAADFNDDGHVDLAVSNSGSNDVSYLAGNGSPGFAAAVSSAAGTGAASLVVTDGNGDGRPDLVVPNSGAGTVSILRNICPIPDLTVTKTHSGNFTQGETGRTYTLTVTNAGAGPTTSTASVTDILPAGLFATAITGSGWNCSLATLTCTRSDVLGSGASYPAVTVTVNVAAGAAASVTNQATVSGGGEFATSNNTASDPTTVLPATDLVISLTHAGHFTRGDTGRTYNIIARNAGGLPTSGTVTVTVVLPGGLSPAGISGTGWTCDLGALSCTRSEVLGANSSYPAITLTVNVGAGAAASVTTTATVSGGGQTNTTNDTALDPTTIWSNQGCGGFGAPAHYGNGYGFQAMVSGHFNGDGHPDLAVTNYYSDSITILLGSANGTFTAAASVLTGDYPGDLALADLNGDGNADLLTANYGASTVSVLLGNGNGTFAAATHYATGNAAHALAIDDFNSDGKPDVAVASSYAGISILLGSGQGALLPKVGYSSPNPIYDMAIADFDNDGKVDVVGSGDYGVYRFAGNGDGTFQAAVQLLSGTYPSAVAAGDFNRDGKPDLAVPSYYNGNMLVLLGNGNGSFQNAVSYPLLGYSPTFTLVVDINGDGKSDLLTSSNAGVITTLLGKGDGTFHPATSISVSTESEFVIGDFNGDATPDLAVATWSSVAVMLGGCADLTLTKSHVGNFTAGRDHAYSLVVNNAGGGSSQGTITVTDALPEGLSVVSMSGSGWTCDAASVTCTRSTAIAAGSTSPAIALTVKVARTAPAFITNTATVSGGGDINTANNGASDAAAILHSADLTIQMTHAGNFAQGQSGKTYNVVVGNVGSGATGGTVVMTGNFPVALTLTAMTGAGWSCNLDSRSCTRSDSLAIDATYPPITLTVSVSNTAATQLAVSASVSGGGDASSTNNVANDPTNILATPINVEARGVGTSQVGVTWTAVVHATSYQVLRSTSYAGTYTVIGSPLSNSFVDATVTSGGSPYFYKIQALDATVTTATSLPNPALVRLYTDDPLAAGTTIKSVHIVELRASVNTLRIAAGLPAISYTDPALPAGSYMKAIHLAELRTGLNAARTALGLPALTYTDPTPGIIRAVHLRELRVGVN